jgi:hypothetical protein
MSIPLKDQVAKMVGEGEELNPPEVRPHSQILLMIIELQIFEQSP